MDPKRPRVHENATTDVENDTTSVKYEVKFTCFGFFNDPDLSDVKLSYNQSTTEFYVHRIILASRSAYFKELFTGKGRKESSPSTVELEVDEIFEEVLETFFEFLYGAPVDISKGNMWLYYKLAELYRVDDLTKVCGAYVKEKLSITKRKRGETMALDPSTCFDISETIEIYENFNNDHVKGYAVSNLMARLDSFEEDLWLTLSKNCVNAILSSETSVLSEKELFSRAVTWLEHRINLDLTASQSGQPDMSLTSSQEGVRSTAEGVLCNIRYCHMSKPSDILEAQMHPFVMASPQLIALVASGCHYKFMKKELAPEEFSKLPEFKKKQYANRRYRKVDHQKTGKDIDTPIKSSPRTSISVMATPESN